MSTITIIGKHGNPATFIDAAQIDEAAVAGLVGTENSLAYKVEELNKTLLNRCRWFGKSADQSGNDWAAQGLTPYTLVSGDNTWGDWAKLVGSADVPLTVGYTRYTINQIGLLSAAEEAAFLVQFVWDATDAATGLAAGNYTETMVLSKESSNFGAEVVMPRIPVTDKMWARCWAVEGTLEVFIGLKEYEG